MPLIDMNFDELEIKQEIKKALKEIGFEDMFPIQENAIPPMMEGKNVVGQAKTGTGKTAAFGVPMLNNLDPNSGHVEGFVLAPTRELAQQITDDINTYGRHTKIWATPIYGGVSIHGQFNELRKNPTIVVGTPGRIMDHMRRGTLDLRNVTMVVLDEADRMFDMGFFEDIDWIMSQLPRRKQVSLWSATIDERTQRLSARFMPDAVTVNMSRDEIALTTIKQYYMVLAAHEREDALQRLIEYFDIDRGIVFCRTKYMVDRLSSNLRRAGISAEPLHGDFTQARRQQMLDTFRDGDYDLLIATELAARGLDIADVPFIINYDIPDDPNMYFHRVGRTARAGKEGTAITFVMPDQEMELERIKAITQTELEKFALPPSFLF
ncbi:MAG TPA: DEAD/DEAH box helicase [Candidatus Krumholzibacteriaceae bacterium]|nr:DEAD/DEAH box helicase [Candidatus Krumholzibacteriaceae bacterium]